jgi:hypothetical protein
MSISETIQVGRGNPLFIGLPHQFTPPHNDGDGVMLIGLAINLKLKKPIQQPKRLAY